MPQKDSQFNIETIMKKYILGNGGFAKEVHEQVFLYNNTPAQFGGFIVIDNNKALLINKNGIEPFTYPEDSAFILGTGQKYWRTKFLEHFFAYYDINAKHFPNFISSISYVSHISSIGIGNYLCPYTTINANAKLGNFNLLNCYSSMFHDSSIEDYNILSPYSTLLGFATAENSNFLGAGATVTPKVTIGSDNTLSAGEYLFDNMGNREFFKSGIISEKPQ